MAIAWNQSQRLLVERALADYPVSSGRCESAAWAILPACREQDSGSVVWRLSPTEGRYLSPKAEVGGPWYHHVTVELLAHCVDSLTGADGTSRSSYLEEHWQYPDAISWNLEEEPPDEPW